MDTKKRGTVSEPQKHTILIVEDDPDINALLKAIVVKAGYAAVQAYSGTEAELRIEQGTVRPDSGTDLAPSTAAASSAFDLILLDLMLPGMTGEELVSFIRTEQGLDTPIIIISAKVSLESKVATLASGADDYITKPFEPEEVLARIQAALRRSRVSAHHTPDVPPASPSASRQPGTRHIYRDLSLDSATRRVMLGDAEVALTTHEFDILHILIKQPDTVFSRERLYELVWKSGYYGEDNTINVHVSNIRKKLAAAGAHEDYIKTVWGIGFKLV
jgi:DNA-binding response OmpR family regulator